MRLRLQLLGDLDVALVCGWLGLGQRFLDLRPPCLDLQETFCSNSSFVCTLVQADLGTGRHPSGRLSENVCRAATISDRFHCNVVVSAHDPSLCVASAASASVCPTFIILGPARDQGILGGPWTVDHRQGAQPRNSHAPAARHASAHAGPCADSAADSAAGQILRQKQTQTSIMRPCVALGCRVALRPAADRWADLLYLSNPPTQEAPALQEQVIPSSTTRLRHAGCLLITHAAAAAGPDAPRPSSAPHGRPTCRGAQQPLRQAQPGLSSSTSRKPTAPEPLCHHG